MQLSFLHRLPPYQKGLLKPGGNSFFPVTLLACCLLLNSCFEVVEEITFTEGRSGRYQMTVNCSQSRIRLGNLFKLDSFMGKKVPDRNEIRGHMRTIEETLRNTPGINEVILQNDMEQYTAAVSFSFDSASALNLALKNCLARYIPESDIPAGKIFSFTGKTFSRNNPPADTLYRESRHTGDIVHLLEGATFTSVFRFNSTVQHVDPRLARISKSGKAVMIKRSVRDIILNPLLLNHSITIQ